MKTNSITNQERFVEPIFSSSKLLAAPKNMTQTAIEYVKSGLSVIPTNKNKRPALQSWTPFQHNRADLIELSKWWITSDHSIATICGKVSGNLELIDFDEKYNINNSSLFEQWRMLVEIQRPGLVGRLVTQTTINKGFHIIYRCSEIERNQKLAERTATEEELKKEPKVMALTLIETRGEGGYFLCYPSTGYSICNGDLLAIPEITPDERNILMDCARSLNELIPAKSIVGFKECNPNSNRPGDVYNKRGDHRPILEKRGWKFGMETDIKEYWQRPGKTDGFSATFNKQMGLFYVWTSNGSPLEPKKAYSKYSLYANLETDGDYKEASKKLAAEGYGEFSSSDDGILIQKVEDYLSANYSIQRNIVTSRIEISKLNETVFHELRDIELNSIHRELLKQQLPIGIDSLDRLLRSNYVEEYDPFVSYFEKLSQWDGITDHIGELAKSVTLAVGSDAKEFRNNLERWFIGLVASAVEPTAVNQTAIIFVGSQGIGKSRWLSRLVPKELSRYQYVGNLDPNNKDTMVYLSECLLINLDELETLRKAEIGALKSIMTQQSIKIRRPYDRLPENLVRRASFVGSINQTEFLNDPTGSRRFLTFEVESFDFNAIPDMDKVMAQAFALFKNGERWWFDEAEINSINERNKTFTIRGHEEELLLEVLPKPVFGQEKEWMTATAIAERIHIYRNDFRVDKASVRDLGYALVKNGYAFKKPNNVKKYAVG
jgi:hypothetical protein